MLTNNAADDLDHLLDNYDDIMGKEEWNMPQKSQSQPNTAEIKDSSEDIDSLVEEELRNSVVSSEEPK